ncbi:MAG: XkdX family protein [Oscillospiraceae bacterium]|nr:XkdX family protein [Oscillospiraceae bacterium]
MEKKHSIKLSDGTIIDNLALNGTNYVSEKEIEATIFTRNCSPITFSDGEYEETYEHGELIQIVDMRNDRVYPGWWLAFRQISDAEHETLQIRADVDYIAMMVDVDLSHSQESTESAENTRLETVKNHWDRGLWTEQQVQNVVVNKWSTELAFEQVTGKRYDGKDTTRRIPREALGQENNKIDKQANRGDISWKI